MTPVRMYDTNLAMGLGLIEETKVLLDAWEPPMGAEQLYQSVREAGELSQVSARRLRNIVVRCFSKRYLADGGRPAEILKSLMPWLTSTQMSQLLFLYTCRTNPVLADFVRDVYWANHESAATHITRAQAEAFIQRAIDDNKTPSRWADGQVKRMGRYLTGCCTDFGLLGQRSKLGRPILSYRIEPAVAAYLAYDLHFNGVGDNAVLDHDDWKLFGLSRDDVLQEAKQLALKDLLIVQAAGNVVQISWKHKNMEEVCDVLAQG